MPAHPVLRTSRLRRVDRTRGVAAVEAAIVLPLVITLFVGIVEFGLIFKDLLALSSATQSAARTAAMEPLLSSSGRFAVDAAAQAAGAVRGTRITDAARLFVYDPAGGDPRSSCGSGCLAFTWDPSAQDFGPPSGSWDPCAAGASDVAVMFVVRHRGVTGVSFASPTLVQSAVYRFDPVAAGSVCQ